MAVTYAWTISAMDCKVSETVDNTALANVVKTVHWRYRATDGDYTTEVYGAESLDTPDPSSFITYENFTKAQIEAKLEAKIDMAEMRTNLTNKIALLKNPTDVTKEVPW